MFGRLLTMIEMSRFAHNLALLYDSGIPILRGLEMVAEIVQNLVVREAITRGIGSVRNGATLTSALGEGGLMPTLVMRMIRSEAGQSLEQSLDHVAAYYDRAGSGIIERALTIFNAVLIASLGAMLAAIALGIFVPLYQMMGNLDAAP
jgi:type II secretory pathway component PulF